MLMFNLLDSRTGHGNLEQCRAAWDTGISYIYSKRPRTGFVKTRIQVFSLLLTVPFSKLKSLKNYLRSTMSQERLNGLAMCCIEKDMLDNIDLDTIISDFASKNARRCRFS